MSTTNRFCRFAGVFMLAGLVAMPVWAGDDLSAQWEKAYNAGDFAALGAVYAEDAVTMPPNGPAVEGRAAIEASFKEFMAAMPGKMKIVSLDTETSGTIGYSRGTYEVMDADGNTIDKGKWVDVRKKINGKWHIQYDIFNSDLPLPEGE